MVLLASFTIYTRCRTTFLAAFVKLGPGHTDKHIRFCDKILCKVLRYSFAESPSCRVVTLHCDSKKQACYSFYSTPHLNFLFLRTTIFLIFSTLGYSNTCTQCLDFIFLLAVTMRNTSIISNASSAVATRPGSATNKEGPHDENYNSHSET